MKKDLRSVLVYSVLGITLVLLSGCRWPWEKKVVDKDDVVLLKINNEPVVTESEFYKILQAMVGKMDPRLLPKESQRKVLGNLVRFKLAVKAAKKAGIFKDSEFRKVYKEQKKHMKEELLIRFFEKRKFDAIQVAPEEGKEHFEKNKSLYVKEQGGPLVYGVSFKDRNKALDFYNNMKDKMKDFVSIGKKEKAGRFREFGRVSDTAAPGGYNIVPQKVKEAALKLAKLPAIDVVKDEKETWVIHVDDKKEAVLYEYDEVAERIVNQLKVNKFMEYRKKLYDDLEKEFTIDVNEEFFKVPEAVQQPEAASQPEAAPQPEAEPQPAAPPLPSGEASDKEEQ